ncbi:hypothetical protein PILCRDRAFT_585852 [Piloderma croceum F 1598]|uniref:Uncharacterized protein n=1 Tax=Piloderma croceum (strain F 1598) TaxID=765440 RepID=A0A0C3F1K5_PILCF|nr:hypothetical protein PILCRDRAFT_585852 [Piloderma croceum F 1598]
MPTRTRRANMPINYQMADCMTVYTGTPLLMQRTHPMAIAMNPPAAARIRLATTGATNIILHKPYGHIHHLTGLIGVLQDLLTSIPRITKPFSPVSDCSNITNCLLIMIIAFMLLLLSVKSQWTATDYSIVYKYGLSPRKILFISTLEELSL